MSNSAFRAALCALICFSLAACVSGGGRHRLSREQNVGTGPKADPVALFIAGLDTNLDGVVTPDELSAALPKLWASADPSGAPAISILDLNNWRNHWFGSDDGWPGRFHFDADGDGSITRKEFETGLKGVFDNFDAHKDGKITRAELLGPGSRAAAHADRDEEKANDDEGEGRRKPRRRGPDGDDD
jgi:hypothetical protein